MDLKSRLYLVIGAISVSFAAIFIRLADAPPLIVATYRIGIASLMILPFTWKRVASASSNISKQTFLLIIIAGGFLAAHFALWITSLEYTSVASSVVLVTANPIFIALASYFLWQEKLGRLGVVGIGIALAGVLVINFGELTFGSDSLTGNMLAIIAGIMAACYLLIARLTRGKIDGMAYLTMVYSVAAILLAVVSILAGLEFTGYSGDTYLMLFLLALVPQILGHSSFNLAARLISVTIVSMAILTEPIGATILSILILGEKPGLMEVIGGATILLGIFVVIRDKQLASVRN